MLKAIYKLKATTTTRSGKPGRMAGLSEGHYYNKEAPDEAYYADFKKLLELRAAILPVNSSIYGQSTHIVGSRKPSVTADKIYPGTTALKNDIPQSACKVTMLSQDTDNQKELKIAIIPDARTVDGEYVGAEGFDAALNAYLTELHRAWGFRGIKNNSAQGDVESISATGLVTFTGGNPVGFAVKDKVRFLGAFDATGNAVTGTYTLVTGLDGLFKLKNWKPPVAGITTSFESGILMKNEYQFCKYYWRGIDVEYPVACTRKVGRPSDQYVGRRSTKR